MNLAGLCLDVCHVFVSLQSCGKKLFQRNGKADDGCSVTSDTKGNCAVF